MSELENIYVEKLNKGFLVRYKNERIAIENEESLKAYLSRMIFMDFIENKNVRDFYLKVDRDFNLPQSA